MWKIIDINQRTIKCCFESEDEAIEYASLYVDEEYMVVVQDDA